ncbi:Holliday junction ATP-dependent DNA helicase RuvA [Ephemeroptericola cinctiostellae]|uniref:Holliday junction branch migration complex subunit RuvA n=1 Tax=Ephemeroptericola cinctiostellae TaxID=2268024 RepID=A0A345DE21_9BURK|nr:Holliday junction branch migration protein RuvA [Ephemeroptericola cinctiostellae]AXF86609.1 Holliday junction ATP-dependent DNA helicase RuvA [Ephemeroptericola cinctiostellae]
MLAKITGTLLEKKPPQVTIDTAYGLAYEIDVPMSTLYTLPNAGEKVTLFLHFAIREDAQQLFGFATAAERSSFRMLIKISGIGARTALGILSGLSSDDLQQAVLAQDISRLCSIPGIGKKTAERLVLELKDKLKGTSFNFTEAATAPHSERDDISLALAALGYADKDIQAALKHVPTDVGVSAGIRAALGWLSK